MYLYWIEMSIMTWVGSCQQSIALQLRDANDPAPAVGENIPHPSYVYYGVMCIIFLLILAALLLPQFAHAECQEFKIVEYEDRVEAVCVGELLAAEENKTVLDEENIQESDAENQRDEQLRLLKENSEKINLNAVVDAEGVVTTGY